MNIELDQSSVPPVPPTLVDPERLSPDVYRLDPAAIEARRRNAVIQNCKRWLSYRIEAYACRLHDEDPNTVILTAVAIVVVGLGAISLAGWVASLFGVHA